MNCEIKAGHRSFLCLREQLVAGTVPTFYGDLHMFYSCAQSPVTVEVSTLASKRAELIANAASCSNSQRNLQKGDLSVFESSSYRKLPRSAGTQGQPVVGLMF